MSGAMITTAARTSVDVDLLSQTFVCHAPCYPPVTPSHHALSLLVGCSHVLIMPEFRWQNVCSFEYVNLTITMFLETLRHMQSIVKPTQEQSAEVTQIVLQNKGRL